MAASITAQLQVIKASFRGREDPVRRPFTRPSVLFDPKEAADIDLRTILPIAASGLDVLVGLDARFGGYRDTLFSHTSLDMDREKMEPKEEEKVNKSVASYLRLLSGYLQLPAALKTLEYLIRRYRVHVFNVDELVLCALPYHDTHAFVRIIQLLDLGNGKWGFLEGVKSTGAPPPRKNIVQQCIRDKGVLEVLCNYASPTKEFQHSRVVVCFCTAVLVEALGTVHQLDSDTVKRVLPFVFSGLNPAMRGGRDDKAGALMVAGLVASRAALVPKLLNNLISFIARMAQQDTKELSDVPWLRMALMTIVNLVQPPSLLLQRGGIPRVKVQLPPVPFFLLALPYPVQPLLPPRSATQSSQSIPKKALKCLIDIRDFPAVLRGLSEEFNIKKFTCIFLETLIDHSSSDSSYCLALTTIIETIPMKDFIHTIVSKVLSFCVKWTKSVNTTDLPEAGRWVKQILIVIDRNYSSELRAAVGRFLEKSQVDSKEGGDIMKTLCFIVDGSLDMPLEISDSKIWFSLEHPKAMVRRTALSHLSASSLHEGKDIDVQKLLKFQDVILRRLHDDELSVVQAALSIDGLSGIITPPRLLNAFQDVLIRCIDILNTGAAHTISNACEVTISCLKCTFVNFHLRESSYLREVATMFFPFLLVLPKTWRISLKALELTKELCWPFYSDSLASYDVPSFQVKLSDRVLDPETVNSGEFFCLKGRVMYLFFLFA
ncbi:hypothetical protein Taro_038031 [Colocasia esculenta]|uniref:U3 small nucleolar RNA-associated protein 10 N-terminal domain-containing protein n=1 Tax=Colocasia esculenta TaxID=4460 RepID=A0A843W743_COLES|nr:hypothetical protein [Colocasia esculenta]